MERSILPALFTMVLHNPRHDYGHLLGDACLVPGRRSSLSRKGRVRAKATRKRTKAARRKGRA